jgi:hypothetical protein
MGSNVAHLSTNWLHDVGLGANSESLEDLDRLVSFRLKGLQLRLVLRVFRGKLFEEPSEV